MKKKNPRRDQLPKWLIEEEKRLQEQQSAVRENLGASTMDLDEERRRFERLMEERRQRKQWKEEG